MTIIKTPTKQLHLQEPHESGLEMNPQSLQGNRSNASRESVSSHQQAFDSMKNTEVLSSSMSVRRRKRYNSELRNAMLHPLYFHLIFVSHEKRQIITTHQGKYCSERSEGGNGLGKETDALGLQHEEQEMLFVSGLPWDH